MLTKEELAERINGRSYGSEISESEEVEAKKAGLLMVFGSSDDLLELRGVIRDEVGAYNGTTIQVDEEGVKPVWENGDEKFYDEAVDFFARRDNPSIEIKAVWDDKDDPEKCAWDIRTEAPHAKFTILDEDEPLDKFCRGVVIHLDSALRETADD
tara:strand:+ start:4885 stop:5349 length:465 start_codon:yes stop_codon:yes gene_type:complete